MNKNLKLEALERMVEEGGSKMEPHMAKCPKCGHKWMMGEDEEYESEDDEYEDDEDM